MNTHTNLEKIMKKIKQYFWVYNSQSTREDHFIYTSEHPVHSSWLAILDFMIVFCMLLFNINHQFGLSFSSI